MTDKAIQSREILREFDGDLVLRRATKADAHKIAEFNSRVHSDDGWEQPEDHFAIWTRDLMLEPHPSTSAADFTLVEHKRTGEVISTMCLIPQTWSYAGIPFEVGRPELVGTHPEYRRRGLVRAQFEVVHQWSAARGHKVQAITGIPWYYRMFGYEMALDLGGGRAGYRVHVPKLKEDEEEPYLIRPLVEKDLPFIAQLYQQSLQRHLVSCLRDMEVWRYVLSGRTPGSTLAQAFCLIETPGGEPVGFLVHPTILWGPKLHVNAFEVKAGLPWLPVTQSAVRYLEKVAGEYARKDEKKNFESFYFNLGAQHPVYQVFADKLPRVNKPYAWYLRLPDLPGFLQHIAPVLEERLAGSPMAGYTGELKLSFFRSGLCLTFDGGRLADVPAWQPTPEDEGMVLFPDLTFLQVLFGYRSFAELDHAFADCYARDQHPQGRPLVEILFPQKPSHVWALA